MWKDIWNVSFFAAHCVLVVFLFRIYGVPGTLLAIGTITCFWILKNGIWPEIDLWPSKGPADVQWPAPLQALGNAVGSFFGFVFAMAWVIGIVLGAVGSLGNCSSSTEYYEPSRR